MASQAYSAARGTMGSLMAAGYRELRAAVAGAGLLERAYVYYAWRGGVSGGILALGVVWALTQPSNPLSAVVIAFGSVQVALIGHDAGHLAVFGSERNNRLLGWVAWTLVLGVGFGYWNDRHTRHHAATNDLAEDPDLQWAGLVAYTDDALALRAAGKRKVLMRYQAVLGPLYTLGLAFAFRAEGWAFALRRMRDWSRVAETAGLATSTVVWLVPTAWLGWAWVANFVLAQTLAGLYLALVIAPNHKGMPTWRAGARLGFLERQVLSSRNVAAHPLTDFVFGGLNYQIEHHLFPTMPRVHFFHARAIVQPFCRAHGLAYQEMGVWRSYGLVLAELQRVGRRAAAS